MDDAWYAETDDEITRAILAKASVSRVFFVTQLLGATPDPWQVEVLEGLDNGDTRISIRSGHGVGKTALCSWCALHYLLFRFGVKIVVTSPSGRQMSDGLKPEINLWIAPLPDAGFSSTVPFANFSGLWVQFQNQFQVIASKMTKVQKYEI